MVENNMSVLIKKENSVVSVHYRGTLAKNGEEFDNSAGREPLTCLTGAQQMIKGFETALIGKGAGEKCTFTLTPDQAYGEHDPRGIQIVPVDQMPEGAKVGDTLALQSPDGQVIPIRVIDKDEENVTLDMNHQLAGESLIFEVEILQVREANDEERNHGMTEEQIAMSQSDCCASGTCSD